MEVMMQTAHQSHSYRLVTYHDRRDRLPYFPASGFGETAEELGPRTNKGGPCLVLLTNVTVSPEEFLAWFHTSWFKTSRNVNRVYFFEKGKTAASREELLEKLVEEGAPKGRIRMQCNPRNLETWLGEHLPEEFALDPKESSLVLEAVQAEGKIWYTTHTSDWLFLNSANAQSRTAHTCSKAHNKLDEALYAAGPAAEGRGSWCAVDLGAAPGSWTAMLAEQVKLVIAVDPAELSDYAKNRNNVVHLKKKSEDCLPEIAELSKPMGGVDLLVCDMNCHPWSMAAILKDVLPLLKKGAMVVMTFKNRGVGRDRSDALDKVKKEFGEGLRGYECIWLLANTVNETTLLAWRD